MAQQSLVPKPARISRSEFLQEYKSTVARKLKVFTSRENVAMSREALREVLAEGRVVLRPDVANARFEGSLVLSHEEFFEQKQIDIKLVVLRQGCAVPKSESAHVALDLP